MISTGIPKSVILTLSIVIPLSVALLFSVKVEGYDFSYLPPIYASINGLTFFLLMLALYAIKHKYVVLHERIIKICLGLSSLFLILYILYHITTPSTSYGGEGILKYIYYVILISHIILSVVVIPFVLFAFNYGLQKDYKMHKKIVRIAFPLWAYVASSGVFVYLMISPYYE